MQYVPSPQTPEQLESAGKRTRRAQVLFTICGPQVKRRSGFEPYDASKVGEAARRNDENILATTGKPKVNSGDGAILPAQIDVGTRNRNYTSVNGGYRSVAVHVGMWHRKREQQDADAWSQWRLKKLFGRRRIEETREHLRPKQVKKRKGDGL